MDEFMGAAKTLNLSAERRIKVSINRNLGPIGKSVGKRIGDHQLKLVHDLALSNLALAIHVRREPMAANLIKRHPVHACERRIGLNVFDSKGKRMN